MKQQAGIGDRKERYAQKNGVIPEKADVWNTLNATQQAILGLFKRRMPVVNIGEERSNS
ncbi:MAG TPA: hypothetical protein H9717_12000 [Candidatus Eisenbergiella merdipullorum]|uniref:Uncharacterized protein n=1 Tax=Candidatus Eisenbergiella merdipullorum TaxID=2838553 RepID=A0A9D2I6F7_9FIRM|nr:hypothetical protein [Candidatus Eisenbergiella merdipullorum]